MKPNVHLHIERLVLHGFEHVNRARLGAAVTGELARLFAEEASFRTHEIQQLDAGTIRAAPGTPAEKLGQQIAQAIYGGINR